MRPTLTVSLAALRANYRLLKMFHVKHSVAAVVKANAYGLGVEAVSKALHDEGCREFFVATLDEGIELRGILPDAHIAVFSGLFPGEESEYAAHKLTPVVNDASQRLGIRDWGLAIIHIDTGMTRLGLSESDLKKFLSQSPIPNPQSLTLMSHLACGSDPSHPKNAEQLSRFRAALAYFPGAKASLCNSSGLFLPPEFHFDVARPGCALYGINPTQQKNPMQNVVHLSAPILQIRTLDRDESIGYGATAALKTGATLAIAALGYADGWPRALSNSGFAYVGGHKVPVMGRVSMDMTALDISAVPDTLLTPALRAEFINELQTVDDVAAACGTIGYETLTRLGNRIIRKYI